MALYSIPVTISATLHVEAESAAEAIQIAKEEAGSEITLGEVDGPVPLPVNVHDQRPVLLMHGATYQGPDDGERATNIATGQEES